MTSMNTKTLTLKATRVTSTALGRAAVLSAFRPSAATIKAFSDAEGAFVQIELDDETGLWSNGRTYEVTEVTISDDGKAMVVVLLD